MRSIKKAPSSMVHLPEVFSSCDEIVKVIFKSDGLERQLQIHHSESSLSASHSTTSLDSNNLVDSNRFFKKTTVIDSNRFQRLCLAASRRRVSCTKAIPQQ